MLRHSANAKSAKVRRHTLICTQPFQLSKKHRKQIQVQRIKKRGFAPVAQVDRCLRPAV